LVYSMRSNIHAATAATFPGVLPSVRGSCAELIPVATCMRHSPDSPVAQSRVY
jgi:hypothetical protein